jgi:hypothetical protein
MAYVDLIKEHLFKNPSVSRSESTSPTQWTPPPSRVILLNSDASVFETMGRMDCLSLVHRLKSLEMDRSSVGLLVDSIKAMTNSFMSVSFIHVKHNLNEAAHILAKLCGSCL